MSRLYKLVLLTFLLSLFLVFDTKAQNFNSKNKYWSIGASLNIMNYVGDVDPGPSFISPGLKFTKYNIGALVTRRISPRVSLRGAFSFGKIGGSDWENSTYSTAGGDVYRKARNLSFKNNIYELKGDVIIDLIEHRGRYQKRPDFVPYLFVGLAYFHQNPKETTNLGDGTQTYVLKDYHTEGQGLKGVDNASKPYNLNQIALPLGFGLRYKLSKQFDLAFEIGWRFTTTDYLDDDGGKYVDKNQLFNAMGGGKKAHDAVLLSDMSWQHVGDKNLPQNANPIVTQVGNPATNPNAFTDVTLAVAGGPNNDRRAKASDRKDAYIITGLHLLYIIPTKVICPKFR